MSNKEIKEYRRKNLYVPEKDDDNDCPVSDDIYNSIMYLLKNELKFSLDDMKDAACHELNRKTYQAITKNINSLFVDWSKISKYIYVAVPYSGYTINPFTGKEGPIQPIFLQKAVFESLKGVIVIAICQNNTASDWYAKLISNNPNCHEIPLAAGIKFHNTIGDKGSSVVIFGIEKNSLSQETHSSIQNLTRKFEENESDETWTTDFDELNKRLETTVVPKDNEVWTNKRTTLEPKTIYEYSAIQSKPKSKLHRTLLTFAHEFVKTDRSDKKTARNNAVKVFMEHNPNYKEKSAMDRIYYKDLRHSGALNQLITELDIQAKNGMIWDGDKLHTVDTETFAKEHPSFFDNNDMIFDIIDIN